MKISWLSVLASLGLAAPALAADPSTPPPSIQAESVELRHWSQGDEPVKLIRKEEGFCALTSVTGHFQGGGEAVSVYIGDDGYWYLGGKSQQEGVSADCIVVRCAAAPAPAPTAAAKPAATPAPTPESASVKILAASYSFGSDYADVTERVRELIRGGEVFQANPECLLADPHPNWNKALVVFCEVRGKTSIFSVGEGEDVSRELILELARVVPPESPRVNTQLPSE